MNLSAVYTKVYSQTRQLLETDRGKKIALVSLLVLFVLLVALQSVKSDTKAEVYDSSTGSSYSAACISEKELEERLELVLSEVDGVGECRVMVTLEKDNYKILAKDSYEDKSGNRYEYVTIETESGSDDGLVVNNIMAQVRGVAVVCEGGGSSVVKSEIISLVTSVLSINSTQVSVSKMK